MKNKIREAGGWIGMLLILGGFAFSTFAIIPQIGLIYLFMNALGAGLIAWDVLAKKSYSAFTLETAWLLISLLGIIKIFL